MLDGTSFVAPQLNALLRHRLARSERSSAAMRSETRGLARDMQDCVGFVRALVQLRYGF